MSYSIDEEYFPEGSKKNTQKVACAPKAPEDYDLPQDFNLPRRAIIYGRVSTRNQANNPHAISMEAQEQHCRRFMNRNNLQYMTSFKEACSGYRGNRNGIHRLINTNRDCTLVVYDASRFARNLAMGQMLLHKCLSRKIKVVFVHELLVWDEDENEEVLAAILRAQREAEAMGRRISAAKAELKRKGRFIGGIPPYGYKAVPHEHGEGKVLVRDDIEGLVVDFIMYCHPISSDVNNKRQKIVISENQLNLMIRNISDIWDPSQPIRCWDGEKHIYNMSTALNFREISNILNDYNVEKRGRRWTPQKVRDIFNREKIRCGATEIDDIMGNMNLDDQDDQNDQNDQDYPPMDIEEIPEPNSRKRKNRGSRSRSFEKEEDDEAPQMMEFEFTPQPTGLRVNYTVPKEVANSTHQWIMTPNPYWSGFSK